MKNLFEEVMSKRSFEELESIISSEPGDYQVDAVDAARIELQRRELFRNEIAYYTNEQLKSLINSQEASQSNKIDDALEEARRRGLKELGQWGNAQRQINAENIVAAGRNLKTVVNVVLVTVLLSAIATVTLYFKTDAYTIKAVLAFLGFAILICNIIALLSLHAAGSHLENSGRTEGE